MKIISASPYTQSAYRNMLLMLLMLCTLLIGIGLLCIYAASSVYALTQCGESAYYVRKQLIGIILGIAGMCIARSTPFQCLLSLSPYFFGISLMLTLSTLLRGIGITIHGSARWLYLGPFTFQPSELLKITYVLYATHLLCKHIDTTNTRATRFVQVLIITCIMCTVLLLQPDFGMSVTLACTGCALIYCAGMPMRWIRNTSLIGIIGAAIAICMKPYRLQRILTFCNPWNDPLGRGFQIIQSLIALGSGGWIGTGIGHSRQKFFYLPMMHTDFILSLIGEEYGTLAIMIILLLYATIMWLGLRIARACDLPAARLVVMSYTTLIGIESLFNSAVICGIAPTKGITLPFISYGNSSMVIHIIMIGIIISAARASQEITRIYGSYKK